LEGGGAVEEADRLSKGFQSEFEFAVMIVISVGVEPVMPLSILGSVIAGNVGTRRWEVRRWVGGRLN
jgi:hypothetical protein